MQFKVFGQNNRLQIGGVVKNTFLNKLDYIGKILV